MSLSHLNNITEKWFHVLRIFCPKNIGFRFRFYRFYDFATTDFKGPTFFYPLLTLKSVKSVSQLFKVTWIYEHVVCFSGHEQTPSARRCFGKGARRGKDSFRSPAFTQNPRISKYRKKDDSVLGRGRPIPRSPA